MSKYGDRSAGQTVKGNRLCVRFDRLVRDPGRSGVGLLPAGCAGACTQHEQQNTYTHEPVLILVARCADSTADEITPKLCSQRQTASERSLIERVRLQAENPWLPEEIRVKDTCAAIL